MIENATHHRMISLRFPRVIVNQPIVCELVRRFNLTFNILRATISPAREGKLVMELSGTQKDIQQGIKYLRELGVKVERVSQHIRRDEGVCYQCGTCTAVCPTGALWIKRPEMEVVFDADKCSACEMCVAVCPPRAMAVRYDLPAA